ncbi:MAG: hypothetical protein JSS42_02900 [Proteobacteria bacterium]|nr:hypothetical protein [Pseudomonadota bacterium]
MNMQRRISLSIAIAAATLLLSVVPLRATAADPTLPTVDATLSRVVVVCADRRLPSQRAVADLLGSNNAAYAYAQREHLAHIARRECLRGTPSVTFVREGDVRTAVLALAH